MKNKELWTEIIAQIVAIVTALVGFYVAPEYQELALAIIVAVEAIALALVNQFVAERQLAAFKAEVRRLTGR
jgi:hypothetical protein